MPTLWAKTVTFDAVKPGDQLPILVKWETEETIKGLVKQLADPIDMAASSTVACPGLTAPAIAAYAAELLEKGFPIASIQAAGSRLELEALRPVAPGDTLVLAGQVVGKQETGGRRIIECEITIENQEGDMVALAQAAVCM